MTVAISKFEIHNFLLSGSLMRMKKIKNIFFLIIISNLQEKIIKHLQIFFLLMKFSPSFNQYRQDSKQTTAINKKPALLLENSNIKPDLEIYNKEVKFLLQNPF